MNESAGKLASIRHYCFVRGILGNRKRENDLPPEDDFRQAFRIVNRLYVEAQRDALKARVYPPTAVAGKRKQAA